MKAGRELDALIAEKVFEVYVRRAPEWQEVYETTDDLVEITKNKTLCRSLQHYSTDIAAAWEVVDTLRAKDYIMTLAAYIDIHTAEVLIIRKGENPVQIEIEAATAAEAICLCALKAVSDGV